jgi:hypothetical protein
VLIRLGDKRRPAQLTLGLGGLRGEDVAHLGLATLELARTGLMKALGCAAVCLQLWHGVPDENYVLDNLLSIYDFRPEAAEFQYCGLFSHGTTNFYIFLVDNAANEDA